MAGRKRGGQPGNTNAVRHGFYSPSFKPAELSDLENVGEGVQEEIDMLRVGLRRLFALIGSNTNPAEIAATLEVLANVSTTIAGLLRTQKFIQGGQSNLSDALSQALAEVCSELSCAK